MKFLQCLIFLIFCTTGLSENESFGTCENGVLFTFVNTTQNFTNAAATCASSGLTLARVSTIEEHNQVKNLIEEKNFTGRFWVGVIGTDPNSTFDKNTRRFSFIDGVNTEETLRFIHTDFGTFPWSINNPDGNCDRNCTVFENCAEWIPTEDHLWNDKECFALRPFLCRGSCPITSPPSTNKLQVAFPPLNLAFISVAVLSFLTVAILTEKLRAESKNLQQIQNKLQTLNRSNNTIRI